MVREPASESEDRAARRRWLRHEAINLGDLVVQIFAVVVGILLALFINDWNTQRQQRANVDEALLAIHAELAQNQTQMHKHYLHLHDMAIVMHKEAKATDPSRNCSSYSAWRGMGGIPVLLDAAYQTAIATQALAEMPFAQAQDIERIYGFQQVEQKIEASDSSIIFNANPDPENSCANIVNEIAENARELDESYTKSLKYIAASTARH